MNHLKTFENFDWSEYGKKRTAVMDVIPELIERIRPLDEFGKRVFNDMRTFQGVYMRQVMQKYGFNPELFSALNNKTNSLNSNIGPHPAGRFVVKDRNMLQRWLDKILGRSGITIAPSDSIIDNFLRLIPEFEKEMKDTEQKKRIEKIAAAIWETHPNNPKNKEMFSRFDKLLGYGGDEEKVEESREGWFVGGLNSPRHEFTEEYFINRATKYKKMMINLSNMVKKYKQEVIDKLEPYKEYFDDKVYEQLLESIDRLHYYINGDTSDVKYHKRDGKKSEKTQLEYSIVELLDKFINKDDSNFKYFF